MMPVRSITETTRLVALVTVLLAGLVPAQWPSDDEEYGLMGCRFFKFNGEWERVEDPDDPDESTEGACLVVAMASIVNYHRWPLESHFDGVFIRFGGHAITKHIYHKWDYDLISPAGEAAVDCENDSPCARYSRANPDWTGEDEIHKLIYVVERSFGVNNDWFRTLDRSCYGSGHYAIEHVMRNRLGYPGARTLPAKKGETRKHVIRNLTNGLPVIAMKCDHVLVIDGYRSGRRRGEGLFHSCDYVSGDVTMGWFNWSGLLNDHVEHFVVDLAPVFNIRRGQAEARVVYSWGEGCVAFTSQTAREGFITIESAGDGALQGLGVELVVDKSQSPRAGATKLSGFHPSQDGSFRIPHEGTLPFRVGRRGRVVLKLINTDRRPKQLRIIFHDFEQKRRT